MPSSTARRTACRLSPKPGPSADVNSVPRLSSLTLIPVLPSRRWRMLAPRPRVLESGRHRAESGRCEHAGAHGAVSDVEDAGPARLPRAIGGRAVLTGVG